LSCVLTSSSSIIIAGEIGDLLLIGDLDLDNDSEVKDDKILENPGPFTGFCEFFGSLFHGL